MEITCQSPLFDLPYLATRHVLLYLGFADLSRLRYTCKSAADWSYESFGNVTRVARMEVIQGTEKTFESALLTGGNLFRSEFDELDIQNETEELYRSEGTQEFLELFGSRIKSLRLKNYFLDSSAQFDFLNAFPSIRSLEIGMINALGHRAQYTYTHPSHSHPLQVLQLPDFFQNLERLGFGTIRIDSMFETDFWYAMIAGSPRLGYLRYPRVECEESGFSHEKKFECFKGIVEARRHFSPSPDWTEIDFKNLDNVEEIQDEGIPFLLFLDFITGMNISLQNVHAEYFSIASGLFLQGEITSECFYNIFSILEYCPALSVLPLKDLHGISIQKMSAIEWENPEDDWADLTSIHLNFDEDFHVTNQIDHELHEMLDFLFFPSSRCFLSELKISFDPSLLNVSIPSHILSARKITAGLTWLTQLTLVRWNPVNKAFVLLWNGLPHLEELWIEDCPSLGNVGFVGFNLENPVFLKLTRLHKLTLVLDEMPKLTDRCFKDVFRHMHLKEFHLRSRTPLPNITKTGILWLLQGEFAKTVERFPFNSWSSATISAKEMLQLKGQFHWLLS